MDCVVAPVDQVFPVRAEDVSVIVEPVQNELGPVIVGVTGAGAAVTTLAADVAVQPLASVTVTVYEPAAETVMDCVVAPVDQRFPDRAEDVRVIVEPAQKEDGPEIVGVTGAGFAVTTLAADVAVQPLASVTVTVYEPATDTVMDCVVAPVDQRFPVADEEVSVIVEPVQKDEGPEIVGVTGAGAAVTTLAVDVAVQPLASVTVTV
jgi:ACT domain-containing protein